VEQTGKAHAPAVLRQLLRRELISLQRGEGGKDDVTYHTTPRFLQLFGLGSLDDLPLPEDLMFK
jgi:segregation and condensation protein B